MLLPDGKTGMVHISEVSNEYVQELSDVLSEGQTVKVKVMNVSDDGKIALSIKRTLPKPKPTRADTGRVLSLIHISPPFGAGRAGLLRRGAQSRAPQY